VKSNEQAWRLFLDFLCLNNLKFLLALRSLSNKTIPSFIIEEKRIKLGIGYCPFYHENALYYFPPGNRDEASVHMAKFPARLPRSRLEKP